MRRVSTLQLLLFFLSIFFTSTAAFSQNLLQPRPTRDLKLAARHEVEEWNKQLDLRATQSILMEQKLIEYALKREKVQQMNLPEQVKLKHIANLNALEITDMRNILTKPQYDWYIYLLTRKNTNGAIAGN